MNERKYFYPYMLWLIVFIAVPLLLILYFAFTTGGEGESVRFSLKAFERFFSPVYWTVLKRSIWLAFKCTLICFLLGYPMAYIISKEPWNRRNTMILLVVIPMWMNFLLRTYAWISLLGKHGFINTFLAKLGLGSLDLMYNDKAVLIGMVYNFLPFMILPIYSVLTKIDRGLLEAAKDLGADRLKVFTKVTFPLSLPGVFTGFAMVFIPAVSTFIISNLLGGNKHNLIGNVIEQQFRMTGDWQFGSAMSIILMVLILVIMGVTNRFDPDKEKGGTLF